MSTIYLKKVGFIVKKEDTLTIASTFDNMHNKFLGHGGVKNIICLFKMLTIGVESSTNLVRNMQERRDLQHQFILFDHVKRVA